VTPAEFDSHMDDWCILCDHPLRWCECVWVRIDGSVPEDEVAHYLSLHNDSSDHWESAMQLWASYRRAQAAL